MYAAQKPPTTEKQPSDHTRLLKKYRMSGSPLGSNSNWSGGQEPEQTGRGRGGGTRGLPEWPLRKGKKAPPYHLSGFCKPTHPSTSSSRAALLRFLPDHPMCPDEGPCPARHAFYPVTQTRHRIWNGAQDTSASEHT